MYTALKRLLCRLNEDAALVLVRLADGTIHFNPYSTGDLTQRTKASGNIRPFYWNENKDSHNWIKAAFSKVHYN